jgi:sugar fermentation stimulation protein A
VEKVEKPQVKGTYALIMRLPRPQVISVGNHPPSHFPGGYYVYVGSALGGIEARVNRHLRKVKKRRWHIDYLLAETPVIEVVIGEAETRAECAVARALDARFESIPGFGASDCRCSSHLFHAPDAKEMKTIIAETLKSLSIQPQWTRV